MPSRARCSGRQAGDVAALEVHGAGGRIEIAGQAVEEGRLAGAVGPDQPQHLALLDGDGRLVDRLEGAEGLRDVARVKQHGAARLRRASGCAAAREQGEQAARQEAGDDDDDGAVDDEGEAGAPAAEQAVGDLLQRHQDQRADQRPEQQPGAAERRHDQHLHRDQDAEARFRIDEAEHDGVERAGDRGEAGAQHVGVELVAAGGDAERARGALGVLDRAQVEAHAAVLDAPGQEQDGARARRGRCSSRASPR